MAVIKDKILVLEDEKSINYLIGTVLTANGYDVIKAYTGTEACQMLDAYCPDLIILDLGLPDMDGVDIIRRIRGWSVVPIIVVSARTAGAYPHRSAPYQDASRRSWIGAYRDLPVWPAASRF